MPAALTKPLYLQVVLTLTADFRLVQGNVWPLGWTLRFPRIAPAPRGVRVSVGVYVCVYWFAIYLHMCVCVCVCVCVCICVCVCVCMYIYIYTYIRVYIIYIMYVYMTHIYRCASYGIGGFRQAVARRCGHRRNCQAHGQIKSYKQQGQSRRKRSTSLRPFCQHARKRRAFIDP
jgi:hypothetical protein